jgi:hypothetical protein
MVNITHFPFVLDRMVAEGYPIPSYVSYGKKEAGLSKSSVPSWHPTDYPINSQENVWLSQLKLACDIDLRPLTRQIALKKVADAAERYGITRDLEQVASYVEGLRTKTAGMDTLSDYEKARDWLFDNAEYLDGETAAALSDHLQSAAIKLGHLPSLTEQYRLAELGGRDPIMPEILAFAESHLHKLASGSVYTTGQFRCLPVDAVRDILPDLLKTASLGMAVIEPQRFGKVAETLCESDADALDSLMRIYGEEPVHSEYGLPVEISDRVLAKL